MHVFYLHGFASSPQSSKAQFLAEKLADAGKTLHCPDLNKPDFSTLTVSRMLQQVEKAITALTPGDVALIGDKLRAARDRLFRRWDSTHGANLAERALFNLPRRLPPASELPLLAPHAVDQVVAEPRLPATVDPAARTPPGPPLSAVGGSSSRTPTGRLAISSAAMYGGLLMMT